MNRIGENAHGAGVDDSTEPISSLHAWLLGLFVCVTVTMAVALGGTVELGDARTMQASTKAPTADRKTAVDVGSVAGKPGKPVVERAGGATEQDEQQSGERPSGRQRRSIVSG